MACQCRDKKGNFNKRKTRKCVYWIGKEQGIIAIDKENKKFILEGCQPELLLRHQACVTNQFEEGLALMEETRNKIAKGMEEQRTFMHRAFRLLTGLTEMFFAKELHNGSQGNSREYLDCMEPVDRVSSRELQRLPFDKGR